MKHNKPKIIGNMSRSQILEHYRKLLKGEINIEEYANLKVEDIKRINIPIYENDMVDMD